MQGKRLLAALLALGPIQAAAQTADSGEQFINAGRAGALVSSGDDALKAILEKRPQRNGDEWSADRTYETIFDAALELDLLRGRACAARVLKGTACQHLFRPKWLLPPRPGLYRSTQLDRFTSELMAEVERVRGPVCARAQAQKIEDVCPGVE